MHFSAEVVQFSPLFAASVAVPWLSIFLIAKPTVGVAAFAARPSWWAVAGAVVFAGIAFLINPDWVHEWLQAVAHNNATWAPGHPYRIPILFPGGILTLLCFLRWKRPEARYVGVLACVPQTPMLYETVPLFMVPRTFWQATVLFALSYASHYVTEWIEPQQLHARIQNMNVSGQMIVLFLYLPATIMILRRPNDRPAARRNADDSGAESHA
jgi:hypothetical protein